MTGDAPERDVLTPRLLRAAREVGGIAAVVIVAAGVLAALGIGCPIKFITGISCPGCGMTRAWLEALRLDFDAALAYHPLFWTVPIVLVCAVARDVVRETAARRALLAVMVACLVAFLVLWAWRMLAPNDLALIIDAAGEGDVVNVSAPRWLDTLAAVFQVPVF